MVDFARLNILQEIKDLQLDMLNMVGEAGLYWERGLEAPQGMSISNFLTKIALSLAKIDAVMEPDEEDTRH